MDNIRVIKATVKNMFRFMVIQRNMFVRGSDTKMKMEGIVFMSECGKEWE